MDEVKMDELVEQNEQDDQCVGSVVSENLSTSDDNLPSSKMPVGDVDECAGESSKLRGGSRKTPRNNNNNNNKTSTSKEELVKPFELGWKREIVQRSTNDSSGSGKHQSDIYYFSPEGKKIRSSREIDMYLTKTGSRLSRGCFSFVREQIYKEPFEITRIAGQGKRPLEKTSAHLMPLNSPSSSSSPPSSSSSSKSTLNASASSAVADNSPSRSSTVRAKTCIRNLHQEMSKKEEFSSISAKKTVESINRIENGRKGEKSSGKHRQQNHGTSTAKNSKRQKIEMLSTEETECSEMMTRPQHLCNLFCVGMQNIPPSLPCQMCMCMFHPECIGKTSSIVNFTCQACMDYPKVAIEQNNNNDDVKSSFKDEAGCESLSKKPAPKVTDRETTTMKSDEIKTGRRFTNTVTWRCAFHNIKKFHVGYDSLLKTFSYLSVPDLLKVRQVCRTWNGIASHPSLWRIVNLKGCLVRDWEAAIKWMKLRGTWILDLRYISNVELSREFSDALVNLPDLLRIEMPRCSGAVAQSVVNHLKSLVYFSAEYLSSEKTIQCARNEKRDVSLDMVNFCGLTNLEVLRLKAFHGIIADNLCRLAELKNLKTLSLTSFKVMSGKELSFLASLHSLRTLEIGDCYKWDAECFDRLSNLPNLKSLRLEGRDEESDCGLGEALLKMTELCSLELIKYTIGQRLSQNLAMMTQLKSFAIHSDILEDTLKSGRCNTCILSTIKKMHFLTGFNWSLTFPACFIESSDISTDSGNVSALHDMKLDEIQGQLHRFLPSTVVQIFHVPVLVSKS